MDPTELILKHLESPDYSGNFGTALHYLRQFEPCFSGEGGICPAKAFDGASLDEWKKELESAAERLVYHNSDMVLDTKGIRTSGLASPRIMEFDHVITTTRKDRDNDVIETKGIQVDSKMPLLWHHMQIQPLGPFLEVTKQDDHVLAGRSAILDTKMGVDTATLVEGGALRISQGFRPTIAEPFVEKSGDRDIVRGWHIKKSNTLEVSLVSVPANADAVITVYSRGKLHDPFIKKWAGNIHDSRPSSANVSIDVSALPETREDAARLIDAGFTFNKDAGRWVDGSGKFIKSSDVLANGSAKGHGQAETGDSMAGKKCPECKRGKLDKTGTCAECGHVEGKGDGKSASADEIETKSLSTPLVTKMPFDSFDSELKGSYEWVIDRLSKTAHRFLMTAGIDDVPMRGDGFAHVGATFVDSAIICVRKFGESRTRCFRAKWETNNDEPRFTGQPEEVTISLEVQKKIFAAVEHRNLADMPLGEIAKYVATQAAMADDDEAADALKQLAAMREAIKSFQETKLHTI